jgi:hypothetical protein
MIFGWNNAIDSIAYNIFVSDFSLVPIVMLMATSINCYRGQFGCHGTDLWRIKPQSPVKISSSSTRFVPLGLGYVRPPPLRFTTLTQRAPSHSCPFLQFRAHTQKLISLSLTSSRATNARSSLPPVLQQQHPFRSVLFFCLEN